MVANAHSTYHALQSSLSGTVGHGGPGIQASYTWSKSLDDTSEVFGNMGSAGAMTMGVSQNPFDNRPEKGPSTFDVTHGFGLSVAQDLHLDGVAYLRSVSKKVTGRLGTVEHLKHQLRLAIYGLLGHSADRRRLDGRGPAQSDRQAASFHSPHKPRGLLWRGRQQRRGFLSSCPFIWQAERGRTRACLARSGRDSFRGPAYYNFDFAFIKDTPFGERRSGAERMDLQYRAEFFNLFNIVNMGLPPTV